MPWSPTVHRRLCLSSAFAAAALAGCDMLTDPATRLAYDMESAVSRLGENERATIALVHKTPSAAGQCDGAYTVQIDKVGAIIIWCYNARGETVSSHSTSYNARFTDTPRTYIVAKPAGSPLTILLQRRSGHASVTGVY